LGSGDFQIAGNLEISATRRSVGADPKGWSPSGSRDFKIAAAKHNRCGGGRTGNLEISATR